MIALRPLLLEGDCLEQLRRIPDASVASVVTDPPYGLSNTDPAHVVEALTHWASGDRAYFPTGRGFMGKEWDAFVPPPAVWDECMRILKPGGHLLAFAGSRTFDLMTLSIRLAGFDIRDSIAWLYGSGFPKSLDVAKAVEAHVTVGGSHTSQKRRAAMGAEYEPSAASGTFRQVESSMDNVRTTPPAFEPTTDEAKAWDGWGTALKPAFEPIIVARKPLTGTVAANVLAHSVGALNIDANRTHTAGSEAKAYTVKRLKPGATLNREGGNWRPDSEAAETFEGQTKDGRWPANVILDESQAAELDEHSGGASRFFYVAKAPKSERPIVNGVAHPTVKPLALMRWLVRLVTPAGECVIDPFAGSGTTLEAAYLEGMEAIGVERDESYLPLIAARLDRVEQS